MSLTTSFYGYTVFGPTNINFEVKVGVAGSINDHYLMMLPRIKDLGVEVATSFS